MNPFSGQWATTLSGGVTGTVRFRVISEQEGIQALQAMNGHLCGAPTTYYHGDYTDTGPSAGTMTACIVTAGHLVGRYRNSNPQLAYPGGDFDVTLNAARDRFAGFFTSDDPYLAGMTFPYSGTFQSHFPGDGCCVPPPPPPPPPGPPPPPPPGGDVRTVREPGPGRAVSVSSPDPLPRDLSRVFAVLTSSGGDLKKSTIVGEGEIKKAPRGVGDAFVACWVLGPDALASSNADIKRALSSPAVQRRFQGSPGERFDLCLTLALVLALADRSKSDAKATQGGCRSRRLALEVLRRRNGRIAGVHLAERQRRPASAPRYGCAVTGPGKVKITVRPGRGTSLRKSLGKRLDLGLVRDPDARRRQATLTFEFRGF